MIPVGLNKKLVFARIFRNFKANPSEIPENLEEAFSASN